MKINEYQKLAMLTLNKELDKKDILINSLTLPMSKDRGFLLPANIVD